MKVKLIAYTKDPEQVVAAAIRQCYSTVGAKDLKKKIDEETRKKLIKQVMASGHTSTLEHASFTFAVEGISRITEVQLLRHRIASYSVQSGRYVERKKVKYTVPQRIKDNKIIYKKFLKHLEQSNNLYEEILAAGIPKEDARYCQPQSLQTKVVITMNARALLNFFRLRCCMRAQWEIRAMAQEMLEQVKKVAPMIFENAGPNCMTEKICFEGEMSCGVWKTIKGAELRKRL